MYFSQSIVIVSKLPHIHFLAFDIQAEVPVYFFAGNEGAYYFPGLSNLHYYCHCHHDRNCAKTQNPKLLMLSLLKLCLCTVSAGRCADGVAKVNRVHEFVMSSAPSGL